MNLTLSHRHACCSHRHAVAFHSGWLTGFMAAAALAACMIGVIRTVDGLVWGQAYKQQVVGGSMQANPDGETTALYAKTTPGAQFRPITDRIFGR